MTTAHHASPSLSSSSQQHLLSFQHANHHANEHHPLSDQARGNLVMDINAKLASIHQYYVQSVEECHATNAALRNVMNHVNELCGVFAPHVHVEWPPSPPLAANPVPTKNVEALSPLSASSCPYPPRPTTTLPCRPSALLSFLREASSTVVEGVSCLASGGVGGREALNPGTSRRAAALMCVGEALWVLSTTAQVLTSSSHVDHREEQRQSATTLTLAIAEEGVLTINEALCVIYATTPFASATAPHQEQQQQEQLCRDLCRCYVAALEAGRKLLEGMAPSWSSTCLSSLLAPQLGAHSSRSTNHQLGGYDPQLCGSDDVEQLQCFAAALSSARCLISDVLRTNARHDARPANQQHQHKEEHSEAAALVCSTLKVLERSSCFIITSLSLNLSSRSSLLA